MQRGYQRFRRDQSESAPRSVAAADPHLTIAADGTVRIGETRYKVPHLAAEHYHHGWSAEELRRQPPDLRPEQVYVVLTYVYDRRAEMLAATDDSDRLAD